MRKRHPLTISERAFLAFYLESTVDELVSMLVDHGPGCPVPSAARALMALAGWTEEDLARAYVRGGNL